MWEFVLGFVGGAVFVVSALLTIRVRGARRRPSTGPIRGYLDLIPNLDPSQRAKVQDIRRTFLPKVAAIRQRLRERRYDLAHLLFEGAPDRSRIHEASSDILSLQAELEREVIEHILEERGILSVEQNQKFYEIILDQFASGSLGVHDVRSGRRD